MVLHPEIEASGLTADQLEKLYTAASGIFLLPEFIQYWGMRERDYQNPAANALGLRDQPRIVKPYEIACDAFNLLHCDWFGQQYGIFQSTTAHPRDNIEKEMDCLSNLGMVCVFFVPPNIFSYRAPESHEMTLTAYEMLWYLENAFRAPPTHFVWGLYSSYRLLLP